MRIRNNKKAFSMVELMLLLLFVSLITAALTPVVTRKHFKLPKPASHGAYLCYYRLASNSLHEIRLSGKALNTVIFDRDVTQCTFEPPQKVSYFHISAIGGGGGGGDSGYTGGSYTTLGPYTEQLSPIGITATMVSETQRDITDKDFTNFGGQLYGYVRGAASGDGGDQQYTVEHHSEPCVEWHSATNTYVNTSTTCTSHHYITECPEGTTCIADSRGDSGSSYDSSSDGAKETGGCSSSSSGGGSSKTCISQKQVCKSTSSSGCLSVNGANIGGQNGIGAAAQNHCIPVKQPGQSCSYECDSWQTNTGNTSTSDSCSYNAPDSKFKLKLPNFKYQNIDKPFALLPGKYAFLFSADKQKIASWFVCDGYSYSSYTTTSVSKVCDEHRDYYSYGTSSYSGGSGAPGAVCRSSYVNGKVGLSYSEGTIDIDAANGMSCYNATIPDPPSRYDTPYTGAMCTPCPATDGSGYGSNSYSTISFNGGTVGAQNAPTGGTGATCTGNGSSGTAGTSCSGGTTVTEGCSPGRAGYCLQRHHRTTWEANASYEFKFTFSQNYLQYGEAGMQGQYRTMVIRSFKNSDNPITIGAGGLAGSNGGKGGTGASTVFGNIITAKGGEGGDGGFMTPPEILPGYRSGATSWPAGAVNAAYESGKRVVRQEGGKEPEKPKPDNLSSNILNFIVPQDNETINDILEDNKVGYGGTGGGSRHNCWFGEYRKWLDEIGTCDSTSYPNNCGELEHSYKLPPTSCTDNYETIDAQPGKYGALIIRW